MQNKETQQKQQAAPLHCSSITVVTFSPQRVQTKEIGDLPKLIEFSGIA